jgi:hydroxylamine dehydrogenase
VLDPEGNPTARLDVVAAAQVARLSTESFDIERAKMVKACSKCHSETLVNEELAKGDSLIEKIDHLMAEAIREIVALYKDGILVKPHEPRFLARNRFKSIFTIRVSRLPNS